jgi:hypothetical protein
VTLTASSTTPGVVYNWTGPGTYASNERTPHVSNPGSYIVTVTNPYNNCNANKSVDVTQNITAPDGVHASASGSITCSNASVTLSSSSSTAGVTYGWTTPGGFTSSLQNPIVYVADNYTLTVTNPTNGCATTRTVTVSQNKTPPANVAATTSGVLNCINVYVTLTGTSSTQGVNYHWTGPDGFDDTNSETFAISPGTYTVTVTDSVNGCSASASVLVTLDISAPVSNIIPPAVSPVALTNNTLSAQLVNNASYLWGISSANPNWAVVSGDNTRVLTYQAGDAGTNGTFTLTVTNNSNGCSSASSLILSTASSLKSAPLVAANEEEPQKTFQVKTYPNPFTDKALIEFTPVQAGHIIVELYNSKGILSKVLFDGEVTESQSYKVDVDGTVLTAGVYRALIRTANKKEVYTQSLILIK